jgi:hypothetical protein
MATPGVSIPDHLRYGLRPVAPKVRAYTSIHTAQNSTYTCTSSTSARIDIPMLTNSVIDTQQSALRIAITPSANTILDGGAHAVIRRLDVYSLGLGTLLESINNYGVLTNLLLNITSDNPHSMFAGSVLMGTSEVNGRSGSGLTVNTTTEYYLPLASILGCFSNRCLPASGFSIVITFEDTINAFRTATAAPTATISNLAYCATILDLGPSLYGALAASNGGTILVPTSSWRNFQSTLTTSTAQTVSIGARASSIKTLLCTMRRNDGFTSLGRCLSDFQAGPLASYQFRIGSTLMPQAPVAGISATFYELCKSFHLYGSGSATQIMRTQYARSAVYDGVGAQNDFGSFALAADLEPHMRNKSDVLLGGYSNTDGTAINLDLVYSAAPVASTIDCFVHMDVVLAFTGNNVTAQF